MLKKYIRNILYKYFKTFNKFHLQFKNKLENEQFVEFKKKFGSTGTYFKLGKDYSVLNPQYISIGENFWASHRFRIEAIDEYENQMFHPEIKIGKNVNFNTDIHIGCINKIEIGDNCLFASRIYITDHDHGTTDYDRIKIPPAKRELFSKGPVVIKNNVWVGEGVAILAGVTIGENSIIATNSVVTKDVPENCVVGGIPAQIIKKMK